MKPTREQALEWAHDASPDMTWYAAAEDPSVIASDEAAFIERLVRRAYAEGQREALAGTYTRGPTVFRPPLKAAERGEK